MTHFWTKGAAEPVEIFADIVEITSGCVLKYAINAVTTVASVTEQNDFFRKNNHESSYYKLYSIAITSFTPPYTLTINFVHPITTKTCKT